MTAELRVPLWKESWRGKAALLFSVLAAVIALYLTVLSIEAGSSPPGCGEGSGCEKVLGSRWSKVFGIPVGAFALLGYVSLQAFLLLSGHVARKGILIVCGAVFGSVLWFVSLQLFVIQAVCPFCMLDHGLGLIAALLAVSALPERPLSFLSGGVGLSVLFLVLQLMSPQTIHTLDLPVGKNFDLNQEGKRIIGLLQGEFQFRLSEEPSFGKPNAQRVVLIMVDYACPHCRRLHQAAEEVSEANDGELLVIVLPTPIHPSCNPAMRSAPDRFEHSCEIATFSLAVFRGCAIFC